MSKAFAYLRVSGRGQVGRDGFPRQSAAVKKYAAAHGLKITRTFEEKAVSGTVENMNRPAWTEMMSVILANGVRTIVIEKLDRLARDLMIQEHIIADLKRRDIAIISVAEPDLCVDDPSRKLLRQIMGAIHEYEKTMLVAKLKAARDRKKAATGKCEGAILFGLLPGEAEIRDRALAMRKAGSSIRAIAEAFNAEGVRPRRGARWHATQIARIVTR
jgi:DNA invertase Pin-like site-specific DNA recombinase